MELDWAPIAIPTKHDDPYLILMLMQVNDVTLYIYSNNCLWKLDILYNNVLDILLELKNNGLPISVTITCMLTFWLLLSLCCDILMTKEMLLMYNKIKKFIQ